MSRGLFPRRTEKMLQGNKRNRWATIHWSTHPQGEVNEAKNPGYVIDWLQKVKWFNPAKLDSIFSQIVQGNWRSHKVYREYHGIQESGTVSRRKKFNRGENPARYLPRRCAITIFYLWYRWCHWITYLENSQRGTNFINHKKKITI